MEIFLSAVLGELTSRSIDFFIRKSSKPRVLDVEDSLQRSLVQAQVIVDEANGRDITNHAMLQQLDMLRYAMHRGFYILDTFRYQSHNEEDAKDQTSPGFKELEVLPIVGPGKVGKSTLVAHVCGNERVRGHFSEILFLRDHDFADDVLSTFREGCAAKHQNHTSDSNRDRRWLLVIDLVGDLNEVAWNMLYSSCKRCMPRNSKIIVTSRSDQIVKFGTIAPLCLKYLSPEAFWYFFKTLIFESMDPKMHPRFVHIAMEITKVLGRCLVGANMTASLLRDNFDIHFWCNVLAFLKETVQRHVSKFGVHPADHINQNKLVHHGRMAEPFEEVFIHYEHESSSWEDLPKISIKAVMYGSVKALGKLEALVWRSHIPPYYSYVVTCEIRELKTRAAKRKRSIRN